ncbi:MAG: oligosaccharide flippase family protein, partial [Candidatus Micrarchaeota archaeon]|nr:oligosaccharide flippase family protein [Candidatus Micrarchaeota archaeon]
MDHMQEAVLRDKATDILYPLFLGQFFGIVLTALTFVVVARLLGPVDYGLYVFAFGFATTVNSFAAFGIGAYFSNTLAKLSYNKDGEGILRTLNTGYILLITVGLILTFLGIALSGVVARFYSNVGVGTEVLMLAAATIIFTMVNMASVSALIGFSRADLASITNVVTDLIQLGLSVVLTIKFGVIGAVAGMLVGYVVGAVLGSYFVYVASSKYSKFRITIPTYAHLKEVFSYVSPIAATLFLNNGMQSFSILFLGLYVTTAALGNYGAASRGLALLAMVYSTLGSGLYPIFTTAKAMDHEGRVTSTYNRIIHFAIMLMLPLVVYVGAMSAPALFLLVSSSYTSAPWYLTLIAGGTAIGLFGNYINNLLISEGYTKSVLKVNAISGILQLVLMVLLVPYYPDHVVGAILAIFYFGNLIEAWVFAQEAGDKLNMRFEYKKLTMLYIGNLIFGILLAGLLVLMNNSL